MWENSCYKFFKLILLINCEITTTSNTFNKRHFSPHFERSGRNVPALRHPWRIHGWCDTSRQSVQLWNSHSSECGTTYLLNWEIPYIGLAQWFPTFLGLRHPTKQKYNFQHLVANPKQFGLSFGDILKISFQWYNKKRISSRHPWVLQMAPQGAAAPRLGTTGLAICSVQITECLRKDWQDMSCCLV